MDDALGLRDDPDAHADLFRHMWAPLVRYARRIAGDAAEDVVQDVFATLWKTRDGLGDVGSPTALLYTMVRNRALNATRRRHWQGDAEDAPEAASDAPSADLALDADDLQRRLHRWIGELPVRRGEAFALSRFHALSHADIARVMGLSERTVGTHILLALRDLRARLDAYTADPTAPGRAGSAALPPDTP